MDPKIVGMMGVCGRVHDGGSEQSWLNIVLHYCDIVSLILSEHCTLIIRICEKKSVGLLHLSFIIITIIINYFNTLKSGQVASLVYRTAP